MLLTRFLDASGVAEVSDFMPAEDAGQAHNVCPAHNENNDLALMTPAAWGGPRSIYALLRKIAATAPDGTRRTVVMGEDTPMNELAIAQHFVLYAALIVAVAVTLEWFETRRTRARAPRRRDHDRPRSR